MRRVYWTLWAVVVLVVGVKQARAQELIGTMDINAPSHIEPVAAEEAPVIANSPVHPEPAGAGEGPVVSDPGPVCETRPSCCQRFWQWLTYHPLSHPCACGCCKPCEPCGLPPLYIFFLCDRWGHCGCGVPVAAPGPVVSQAQNATNQQQ